MYSRPRCDLCEISKVAGLCPSKRKVVVKKTHRAKTEQLEADAKTKIDLPTVFIKGEIVTAELVLTEDTTKELRHVKKEDETLDLKVDSLQW